MADVPFFVQMLLGVLLAGNGYFLVQHFGRMREIEKAHQSVEIKLAVFATTAENLSDKLDSIESRTSAVYGMLTGTGTTGRRHDSEPNR